MNNVETIVARFREEMQIADSKFFLAYTVVNPLNDEVGVKLTSNSSQEGIRAILSAILRPTGKALDLLAQEIAGSARAGMDLKEAEITQLLAEGRFREGAKVLFEQLRMLYTIVGWEDDVMKPKPPVGRNDG